MKKFLFMISAMLLMVMSVTAQARTLWASSTDGAAEMTAFFEGTTMTGVNVYDTKCDGDAAGVVVRYKLGTVLEAKVITNRRGCGTVLWYGTDIKNVTQISVCRFGGLGDLISYNCRRINL